MGRLLLGIGRRKDCSAHLYEDPPAQSGLDERLGDPACCVRRRAVDLGEVLAGEGAASVSSPAAVRVDDDLPSGQTCVTLQTPITIFHHGIVNRDVWTLIKFNQSTGMMVDVWSKQ